MDLLKSYTSIIWLFFIVACFQFIPWSDYFIWYGKDSIIENFQYLLMILSFIIFIWSWIFLLNNFLKNWFWMSIKNQNWKIFFLSFGFLAFSIIQFASIRLMMDSWTSFVNMQITKKIPNTIKNGQAIYANPQPAQVLNK